jgi:hypothetical protein
MDSNDTKFTAMVDETARLLVRKWLLLAKQWLGEVQSCGVLLTAICNTGRAIAGRNKACSGRGA